MSLEKKHSRRSHHLVHKSFSPSRCCVWYLNRVVGCVWLLLSRSQCIVAVQKTGFLISRSVSQSSQRDIRSTTARSSHPPSSLSASCIYLPVLCTQTISRQNEKQVYLSEYIWARLPFPIRTLDISHPVNWYAKIRRCFILNRYTLPCSSRKWTPTRGIN